MVVVKNGNEIKVDNLFEALEKLGKTVNSGKENCLAKHFGKLKRGYDGLQYQREARHGWD